LSGAGCEECKGEEGNGLDAFLELDLHECNRAAVGTLAEESRSGFDGCDSGLPKADCGNLDIPDQPSRIESIRTLHCFLVGSMVRTPNY